MFLENFKAIITILLHMAFQNDGWVQHYPKCLYKV